MQRRIMGKMNRRFVGRSCNKEINILCNLPITEQKGPNLFQLQRSFIAYKFLNLVPLHSTPSGLLKFSAKDRFSLCTGSV